MANKINVGDVCRDRITGFKGVCECRTEWLNGCARIGIRPQELTKDGKLIDIETFDEQQVELVGKTNYKPIRETGGPRPDRAVSRMKDPK